MPELDGYRVRKTQQLEDLTSGLGESLSATAEQIWTENPSSSAFRLAELESAAGREPPFAGRFGRGKREPGSAFLDKKTADEKVNEAGVPLTIGDDGIREGALDLLISRKREEIKRKSIIDAAPSGFWNGTAQIATGLAVSIADPINVASAFVPVIGQARYANLLAKAGTAAGRLGVRTGVGVTEGAVGAALVEPLVLIAAEAEQADYGLYDSFMNLTFGAVLGGGLHVGLGAVGDAIGRSSPQTKESLLKGAMGQVMDDKPIDVGFIAKSDASFREEWRAGLVDQAIRGEVDPRIAREFNAAMDSIKPELVTRAAKLEPKAQAKALADIEAGKVPDVFVNDVAKTVQGRIADFESEAPKVDAQSPEASIEESIKADQRLIDEPEELDINNIDQLNDDILTAIDEIGGDTVSLRAEIEEINTTAEREGNGLREAVNCMLGR